MGFLSICIYVKNMHEVRRLKPTICEIFTKMPKNILSCLNNRLQLILVEGKKYVLIQKILIACRQLLLAKGRDAVHFNICCEFQSIVDFCVHFSSYGPCSKLTKSTVITVLN